MRFNKNLKRASFIIVFSFLLLWSPEKFRLRKTKLENVAFALKTGKDVALDRIPSLLDTYFSNVTNMIIVAEASMEINGHELINVVKENMDEEYLSAVKTYFQFTSGWAVDAFKFLPGFRELFNRFPSADWFLMVDDDTYIIKENLLEFLSYYDPRVPIYFGSSNTFWGCDNVYAFGDGPFFAQGGAGIILSNEAMLWMMDIVETCIWRYELCWAGDIRTALCLRDTGILLTPTFDQHENAPNDQFNFGDNPCEQPISFHHLSKSDIRRLHELETVNPKIRYQDIVAKLYGPEPRFEIDLYRQGQDFLNFTAKNAEQCLQKCKENRKCSSFSYENYVCHLKSGIYGAESKKGAISGVVAANFHKKCHSI